MKRLIIALLVLLMVSTVLFANGAQESGGEKSIKLVAATINPDGSLLGNAMQAYFDEIEAQSEGKINVDFFLGGQLGDASTLYQSVVDGTIDIILSDPGWFAERHPVFDILTGNYLFTGKEHYESVVNGDGSFAYFENLLLDDPGVVVLMYVGGLERDIISTMPINSVDDLKGVNMRSKSASTNMDWWSSLGANPVPVSFNETYTAVQTGVVNGSQNSLDAMISMRFGEVEKYVARTQHNLYLGFIVMNKEKYDSLGADLQGVLASAAKKVQPVYIEKAFQLADEALVVLQDEFGVTVTDPERGPFIEASRKQINELAAKYDFEEEFSNIFE